MTSGQIVGKMDTQKQLNVPLDPRGHAAQVQDPRQGRGLGSGVAFCHKIRLQVEKFH